jgi:hypothetical protein
LLESSLARINWIRAVYQFCVEQLISCQKCRANGCRAIAFRAVHPHSIQISVVMNNLRNLSSEPRMTWVVRWSNVSDAKSGSTSSASTSSPTRKTSKKPTSVRVAKNEKLFLKLKYFLDETLSKSYFGFICFILSFI